MDTPLIISGNYGELRPNHFHAGIDFSTNNKVNLPVYAAADGYVSRIKVSPYGYGKAIYITHPNGQVTVYAHLNSYDKKIAAIVKQEQYARKNYEIDVYPKSNLIRVQKGEIIAYSGNTGGSTGPHLHFELRDEKTETPLNLLKHYSVKDTEKPKLEKIAFYDLADTIFPKYMYSFTVKNGDTVLLDKSIVGLAFAAQDKVEANGKTLNVFSAELFFDEQLIYSHTLNHIDFDESRYVNEFAEKKDNLKFQKCFLPTLYPKKLYGKCLNKGRMILDNNYHQLKLTLKDEKGNERVTNFWVKAKTTTSFSDEQKKGVFVNCNENFKKQINNVQISISAKTFYNSAYLSVENTLEKNSQLSVLPESVNFKKSATIGFAVPKKFLKHKHKLLLKNGSNYYTPTVQSDSVFYSLKNFGTWQLVVDSFPPKISLQKKSANSVSFTIEDKMSGISKYNVFVNDKWVIAEYDAKSDTLTYFFDEETLNAPLKFRVEVEDRVGNKAKFNYTLERR
ncbi:MAG: M23 family metallopeptidase [Bacteroidetes bacterium]|nr:M23 family metallopeptidase [Bacteroidota bacterium]